MNKKVKSGKIEFYRFVFCMAVLFFHIGKYMRGEPSLSEGIHPEWFPHGSMGVEYFFLISGYFMARSIYQKVLKDNGNVISGEELSKESLNFVLHKYLRILPEHIPAFALTFAVYCVVKHRTIFGTVETFLANIPSMFLIQMTGINISSALHIEWYISCMLIVMLLLYPVCRKHYYMVTRVYGPLLAALILGYMCFTTGAMTGVMKWMGVAYKSLFRAFVDIILGMTCFEAAKYLKQKIEGKPVLWHKVVMVVEIIFFLASIGFIMMTFDKKYEFHTLAVLMVLVIIAGSGVSYGDEWFNNRFCYFLGNISLPVYLCQLPAIYLMEAHRKPYSFVQCGFTILALTTVFSIMIMACAKPIHAFIEKYEKN